MKRGCARDPVRTQGFDSPDAFVPQNERRYGKLFEARYKEIGMTDTAGFEFDPRFAWLRIGNGNGSDGDLGSGGGKHGGFGVAAHASSLAWRCIMVVS